MTNREIIRHYVPETEIRFQMAEETAELYQALSKWRRAHLNIPGHQVSEEDALKRVTEELGDVILCGGLLWIFPANATVPDWALAPMDAAVEILRCVHSEEPTAAKQSLMLGKIVAWAKMQGITEQQIGAVMFEKEVRWRERLEADK